MKPAKQNESALFFSTLLNASFLFEAAIHPMRRQILGLFTVEKRLSARTISLMLLIEEDICTDQLSILCGAGLLKRRLDGDEVFYLLDEDKLQQLYACAEALLEE